MYALIRNGRIVQAGTLPRVWWDGTRWWDLRDPGTAADAGWHPVTTTARPADTDTHTHDPDLTLDDGRPVQTWTARVWTLDELDTRSTRESTRLRAFSDRAVIEAVTAQHAADYAETPATPWDDLDDRVAPGQAVIWTDGHTWRNIAGAWLPTTATPETWPQGWAQETGLPADIPPWVAGETVTAGDLRTYDGITYRCIQGHTTQHTWEPPGLPALWTPQG